MYLITSSYPSKSLSELPKEGFSQILMEVAVPGRNRASPYLVTGFILTNIKIIVT